MKLNEKIIYARKKAGMSQIDLADAMEVSRQSVSKWETGESNPEISKLPTLAKILNVTTDWLLSEEEVEEIKPNEKSDAAYPEWVDRLPGFVSRMIRRYGWVYGVSVSIRGILMIALVLVYRYMLYRTNRHFYEMFPDQIDEVLGPQRLISGIALAIGAIITIAGIVLTVLLKRWKDRS